VAVTKRHPARGTQQPTFTNAANGTRRSATNNRHKACLGFARAIAQREEDPMAFEPGDVVMLKSGGHSMTVVSVGDEDVDCLWVSDDGELFRQSIPAVALTVVEIFGGEDTEHAEEKADEAEDEEENDEKDEHDEKGDDDEDEDEEPAEQRRAKKR
jgi:uncharacterized protein YodC (DUF2158 family)